MAGEYSPQTRVERLVATGRMVLAVFSLVAIRLDPSTPVRYAALLSQLLACYALYALLLALLDWSLRAPLLRLRLLTHVFDLAVFSVFMFLTEGPTSPFFVYFVFSLLCATLRWHWRGVAWTAASALAAFVGIGFYAGEVLRDPGFELNRFIIRGVYLAVVAVLLGYLGAFEERVRREVAKLAAWPRAVPGEARGLAAEVLEYAAAVLGVSRALLLWDEPEEPWRHVACLSSTGLRMTREPPAAFDPIVPAPLDEASFFCADAREGAPTVLHTSSAGLRSWTGVPLHADLCERFAIRSVLGLRLRGQLVEGRLLLLDRRRMTSDDLVLGEIVARQAAIRLDHFYLSRQLQRAAATEERVRLARDLHDGVLQSLAGAALQLETARRLVDVAPADATLRLAEVQRVIAAEQRDLRAFIRHLKPSPLGLSGLSAAAGGGLEARLSELRERIAQQWGLRVELRASDLDGRIPVELAHELYRIVQEALVNAARHAHATEVKVELTSAEHEVRMTVTDDGRGFAFQGHYDLTTLNALDLGPATLKERVASQGGTLVLDSTERGTRLVVTVPLAPARV